MTQTEIEALLSDAEQSLHQQFSALDKIEQVCYAEEEQDDAAGEPTPPVED